jgi:pantothenate kinase type III
MILGVLLGNASVRFGLLGAEGIRESGRMGWDDLPVRGGEIERLASAPGVREAVAASVRDDLLPLVERWIPERLRPLVLARRDFALPIQSLYERPEEAGTDRLLNAIALGARAAGRAAIAVDFGTAVSVTVVDRRGAFAGGLIASGGRTTARGLSLAAPRLPEVDPRPPEKLIATSARSAVSGGVYLQVAGGVSRILRGILEEIPGALVVATGGEAELFAPAVPEIYGVVPELGLEGLAIACRSRRKAHG